MTCQLPGVRSVEDMSDPTIGALIAQASEQSSQLIRDEIRLAQAETTEKLKHAGVGVASFGTAGILALYGVGLLLAAAVAGLATALSVWLSALIIGVVVLVVAGIAALVGKKQVGEATPLAPQRAVAGAKLDVATIKGDNP